MLCIMYAYMNMFLCLFDIEGVAAQRKVSNMQGQNGTYFCGAWMGYGFHEDG